jgi:phosphate transport system substrate-binding protein
MSSAKPWTCDGEPRDGKSYPHCSGSHEPYENYGPDCVMCGLPREAIIPNKGEGKPDITAIAVGAALVVALLGTLVYLIWPKPQPQTQSVRPVTIQPITPSQTTSVVSPAPIVNTYRTLAEVPNVPSVVVNYGGSTTFAPLRSPQIVAAIASAHPGFELRYLEPPFGRKPGSGTGIRMLLDGQLTIAQSSRSVETKEFEEAKTKGFELEQVPVAIDGIAFYVHPQLSISGLTVAQIKDIFTGKITNWKEVGGPDLDITPVSRPIADGGTPEYFHKEVLSGENFASTVQEVRDTTTGIQRVAKTSAGIGYATASEVIQSTIRPLPIAKDTNQPFVPPVVGNAVNKTALADGSYPITRQLFVAIRRDRQLAEQAGVAYANMLLSDEGQRLVEQAGFVPIRK